MPGTLENVLILAHPGHELRIHHWLELAKPRVYVLTDGSGAQQKSRTRYSRDVVEATGAMPGAVFGDIPDAAWYEALLARNHSFFVDVLMTISADLACAKNIQVVSDAVDGYNPMHDLAYSYGQALTALLKSRMKVHGQLCSAAVPDVAGALELEIQLDQAARARKMAAVQAYTPLADEARRILERDPLCFDREKLISQHFDWNEPWTPEWEVVGRQRVAAGIYGSCITYRDNVRPIAQQLEFEGARTLAL